MAENKEQQKVKIRYNETFALFASQFVVNVSPEDITINFSSGALNDPGTGEAILPIHTRIAMTRGAALRLLSILNNVLAEQNTNQGKIPAKAQAKLPEVKQ